MGRPTKLTDEVQDVIVGAVKRGNFLQTAAGLAAISDETIRRWLERGRSQAPEDEPYRAFCVAVRQAEAESEAAMVGYVVDSAPHDARQAQWHLERRWAGKRWQQRKELAIDGEITTKRLVLSQPSPAQDRTDEPGTTGPVPASAGVDRGSEQPGTASDEGRDSGTPTDG